MILVSGSRLSLSLFRTILEQGEIAACILYTQRSSQVGDDNHSFSFFGGIGMLLPSLPALFSELLDFSFGEEVSKRNGHHSPHQLIPGQLDQEMGREIIFSYVKKQLNVAPWLNRVAAGVSELISEKRINTWENISRKVA